MVDLRAQVREIIVEEAVKKEGKRAVVKLAGTDLLDTLKTFKRSIEI